MRQFLRRLLIAIIWIVASPVGFGLILTPILIDSLNYGFASWLYYIFGFSILVVAFFLHRIINRILIGSRKEDIDLKKDQLGMKD